VEEVQGNGTNVTAERTSVEGACAGVDMPPDRNYSHAMQRNARIALLLLTCLLGPAFAVSRAEGAPAAPVELPPAAWPRYNGWQLKGFRVTGLPAELAAEGVRGLRLSGEWKLLKGRVRPDFSDSILRDDLRRLRLFLARHGYPASRATVTFSVDVTRHSLMLAVAMVPGPPVLLEDVRFEGWPEGVAPGDTSEVRLPARGAPLVDQEVEQLVASLRMWLLDAGFADVGIEVGLEAAGPTRVILVVDIDPGERFTIVEVDVAGCSSDLVPVARRVMDIDPGTPFGGTLLEEAATDLRITQLFGQVELATEPVAPGELSLTAELVDAQMRSWRASVGTWSDNPWVLKAGWEHRNLLKRGRGFDLHGTYATHLQEMGAVVYRLGLLSPRARTSLGSLWRREDEDAYLSEEYRLALIQAFRPRDRALMNVGVALSVNDVEIRAPDEDELPEEQDWMLEVWGDRKWDWADDILYPTRGGYIKVRGVVAPPSPVWGNSYVQIQLDGVKYLRLGGRFVAAGRIRYGASQPLGGTEDILANRRFFAGGYNTMRGYERRKLGPRDSSDNPRGGQTVFLAGAELRSRLFWLFDAAVFFDSGQVWREHVETNIDGLAYAVGANLDVRTPLGPLRVGYAWNLVDVYPGEPDELWHFGIGYPW
jgi:outer membrane protein assembly factor BamA